MYGSIRFRGVARRRTLRITTAGPLLYAAVLAALVACGHPGSPGDDVDASPGTDAGVRPDASGTTNACPAGPSGLQCLMDLFDEVSTTCDTTRLDDLRASLTARHGDLPAWYQGRALFVTYGGSAAIAGDFDSWSTTSLATEELCGSEIFAASASIPTGFYTYKLVYTGSTWKLDPENWAFAYDDFAGNADGANSVLDTYDSGRGHLVQPDIDICSDELGNCRRYITYLPPGYGDPAEADRNYPVLFMHDAQNIYNDHDCCFGHTGWEVNVQLDTDIAAGVVEPVVVVGFPHGGDARTDEYGNTIDNGGEQETFMAFQVGTVQPRAAELWRIDLDRAYVAGSSLGGLLSFRLAFAYPDVYAGAASLSGSYWLGEGTGEAMSDFVEQTGFTGVPLYQDHGGTEADGGDNYPSNVALRDQLKAAGWTESDSPDCTLAAGVLCYFHDVGATHNELAWRDRTFRFLRFFFGVSQ